MDKYPVCRIDALQPGMHTVVVINGRSIGVFNVDGEFYAIRNLCPHQGAELCAGTVAGTMLPSQPKTYIYGMEDRIVRCPWHGWEFDITTGCSLFDPDGVRVRRYPTSVENDTVMVELDG